ncbi:MAG: hypothetical protein ACR2P5_04125 [Gammaproteobacteria bacterium]
MKNINLQPDARKAAELFNEAAQSAADYSSKVAARQTAFARKMAEQHKDFSWEKLLSAPAEAFSTENAAVECAAFARELAEDFAEATGRHLDIWERTIAQVAENAAPFFPQTESYRQQWVNGVKTANAALKDGVRASCGIAEDAAAQTAAAQPNGRKPASGKK